VEPLLSNDCCIVAYFAVVDDDDDNEVLVDTKSLKAAESRAYKEVVLKYVCMYV
jgi:hypothetical protein